MPIKREQYPMPDFVLSALKSENLLDRYNARPPYQRNDYIGCDYKANKLALCKTARNSGQAT